MACICCRSPGYQCILEANIIRCEFPQIHFNDKEAVKMTFVSKSFDFRYPIRFSVICNVFLCAHHTTCSNLPSHQSSHHCSTPLSLVAYMPCRRHENQYILKANIIICEFLAATFLHTSLLINAVHHKIFRAISCAHLLSPVAAP